MSDVVFVVPSELPIFRDEFLGTILLATILKKEGVSVDIYRFWEVRNEPDFFSFVEKSAEKILAKQPRIVSFYCRCDCYLTDIMIAKKLKELAPQIYIVFGGPQADASAFNTLNEIPWVDFCCRGEGETTVYPLFSALLENRDYSNIPGLSYRSETQIVENPLPALIEDLDTLPFLDYSFLPEKARDPRNTGFIDVGRGCPFKCAYCSTSLFWQRKFRIKSASRIAAEMTDLYDRFGITKFNFQHDLFTASKKRVLEFTKTLKETGKAFTWTCSARVDTLDEESIRAMAESGLTNIYLGIESGSERMQKLMNKNLKVRDVISIVSLLRKYNIAVTASFMYGLPEETEEDLEQTLQLVYALNKLGVSDFQYHLCSINPGTEYYYKYLDQLTLTADDVDQVAGSFSHDCDDFVQEHLKVFSFYFEYKSVLRDKYAKLNQYTNSVIATYHTLKTRMPDAFRETRICDMLLDVIELSKDFETKPGIYEIAKAYCTSKFSGETLVKLHGLFDCLRDRHHIQKQSDTKLQVKTYPVDARAVFSGNTLDNIPLKTTMAVYTKDAGGKLSVRTSYV